MLAMLGAVMLLIQVQQGAISIPLPKAKPGADAAAAAEPSTASLAFDPADFTEATDLSAVHELLERRAQEREDNQTREFRAARNLAQMQPEAAAALLAGMGPVEAAALLQRLPARHSGPILEAAPPQTATDWLTELKRAAPLSTLPANLAQEAAAAGWQSEFPEEDLPDLLENGDSAFIPDGAGADPVEAGGPAASDPSATAAAGSNEDTSQAGASAGTEGATGQDGQPPADAQDPAAADGNALSS